MKETRYISYGGGVNSTTFLILEETKMDEAVFVDHGADFPFTYEYVTYLQKKGFDITVIKPSFKCYGKIWTDLYTFCYENYLIPFKARRWCTGVFKIDAIEKYVSKPCIQSIGFDYGELKRMERMLKRKRHGITYEFPLIKNHISREKCKEIISDAGLKVPEKSGCYFCPFKSRRDYQKLFIEYPELYKKALILEERYKMKHSGNLLNKPLYSLTGSDTQKLENWGAIPKI